MAPIKNPSNQKTRFKPGDEVYARYFGDDILIVRGLADAGKPFPHYLCSLNGKGYVLPQLHLSGKRLLPCLDDNNRRQLVLPISKR